MTKRDYYQILGVGREAAPEEIKKTYRRLAQKYHPDKNPDDTQSGERFMEINEAYSVLSDPERRSAYDRYGHLPEVRDFGDYSDFSPFGTGFGPLFEDLFEGFFGTGSRRRSRAQRGSDLRYDLEIELEEVASGAEKKITIPRQESCSSCFGHGARRGTQPSPCPTCRGTGQVRYSQGFFSIGQTCNRCGGEGQIVTDPCPNCSGRGRVKVEREISVRIPAGVETGTRLRIAGEGESGSRGGPRGDLYLQVEVLPHPFLSREGDELLCEGAISYTQAALGGEIEVPTLNGSQRLHIPAGTPSGKVFPLKGKGLPNLRGNGRGDQQVKVMIKVPTKLSPRERELLQELAALERAESVGGQKGIFDRIKGKWG